MCLQPHVFKFDFFFFFWPRCTACEILVPQPGIKPGPPAVEAQSPNHWIAREFPKFDIFDLKETIKIILKNLTKLCVLYEIV